MMKVIVFWFIMAIASQILIFPLWLERKAKKAREAAGTGSHITTEPEPETEETELSLTDKIKLETAKSDLCFQLHKKRDVQQLKTQAEKELAKELPGGKEYCKFLKKVTTYESQLNAIEQRIRKAELIITEYEENKPE
jgi:hypothetical protein